MVSFEFSIISCSGAKIGSSSKKWADKSNAIKHFYENLFLRLNIFLSIRLRARQKLLLLVSG